MGIINPNYHHGYVTMCVYTSKVWELVNQHHWYVLYTVTTTNLFNYKTTLCVYTSKGMSKALVVGRVQMSEAIPSSSLPLVTGADPQNCNKQVGYNKCNRKELLTRSFHGWWRLGGMIVFTLSPDTRHNFRSKPHSFGKRAKPIKNFTKRRTVISDKKFYRNLSDALWSYKNHRVFFWGIVPNTHETLIH